jgi:hypothetical protein
MLRRLNTIVVSMSQAVECSTTFVPLPVLEEVTQITKSRWNQE